LPLRERETYKKRMIEKGLKQIMKTIATIMVVLVVVFGGPTVYAFDFPTPPSAPTPPPAPTAPPAPAPDVTPPPAPTAPPAPWEPTPTPEVYDNSQNNNDGTVEEEESVSSSQTPDSGTSEEDPYAGLSGTVDNGNVGDTEIDTGDATNAATIANDINSNLSSTSGSSGGGATIINDGNGEGSTNNGSAAIITDNTSIQGNSASVVNDLVQSSVTGENSASRNVGNSVVTTGDANTTGTIVNSVNTNIDGVAVAEFNVMDDHVGDIILDFGAGCILGCTSGDFAVQNSGNGADSTNSGNINSVTNNNTFQTNDANVENNMTLEAISGGNLADSNTGGNSTIETGDSNVSANVLTFANNNIEGNVLYAVVNIFGNLVGDILLPDLSALGSCCGLNAGITNSGNGSESTNTGSIDQTVNNELYQFNSVELENNLVLDATSGGNSVSRNTGGDSSVETGDTSIEAQVLNIANTNLAGGNWWLVLVNEAGRWIGRIVGAQDGANWAGSDGFEFLVNEAGEITVVNSGNGEGSTNTGTVTNETNNITVQDNNAHIVNNLNLSAISGNNSASKNTGGNSSIVTGDANIVANIVNFVNNNISGGGKLLVTVVNVFGSWLGDFVGPGQHQESDEGVGGAGPQPEAGPSSSSSSSSSSGASPAVSGLSSSAGGSGSTLGGNLLVFSRKLGISVGGNSSIVLGDETQSAQAAAAKVVRVNLAWALAALFPFGLVVTAVRRRKAILRVLTFFL